MERRMQQLEQKMSREIHERKTSSERVFSSTSSGFRSADMTDFRSGFGEHFDKDEDQFFGSGVEEDDEVNQIIRQNKQKFAKFAASKGVKSELFSEFDKPHPKMFGGVGSGGPVRVSDEYYSSRSSNCSSSSGSEKSHQGRFCEQDKMVTSRKVSSTSVSSSKTFSTTIKNGQEIHRTESASENNEMMVKGDSQQIQKTSGRFPPPTSLSLDSEFAKNGFRNTDMCSFSKPAFNFSNSKYGFGANINDFFESDNGRNGWFSGMPSPKKGQVVLSPMSGKSAGKTKTQQYSMHASKSSYQVSDNNKTYRYESQQITESYEYYSENESDDEDEQDFSRVLPNIELRRALMPFDRCFEVEAPPERPALPAPAQRKALPAPQSNSGYPYRFPVKRRDTDTLSLAPSEAPSDYDPSRDSTLAIEYPMPQEEVRQTRHYKVAKELAHTEKTYRDILYLLDQMFQERVKKENAEHKMFPPDMVSAMFGNIHSLYQFHNDHLLPQLQRRIDGWDKTQKIGDIMKSSAPFLKMYTEYIKNYDQGTGFMNLYANKCARFSRIIEELQETPECVNLPLPHHMLSPVQRIPRYQLLLTEYLKRLPPDNSDRSDTEEALRLVSVAAQHANDSLKKVGQFKQLLEAQEALGGALDLVSPSRILIKQGNVKKISGKTSLHQDRHLYLFSDLLVVCSGRVLPKGPMYKARAIFDMCQMQVLEGDNLEVANSFFVLDSERKIEFYTQTKEEKESWLSSFYEAMQDLMAKKKSFTPEEATQPPPRVKAENVAKCMECQASFSSFKKRYHCKACGAIVCKKCGDNKRALRWSAGKPVRVCNGCNDKLKNSPEESPSSPTRPAGLMEVAATVPGTMAGWLQFRSGDQDNKFSRRWFVLRDDHVLFSYEKQTDKRALTATPVPGFTVEEVTETGKKGKKTQLIKLQYKKKSYYFLAGSTEEHKGWLQALENVSHIEPS